MKPRLTFLALWLGIGSIAACSPGDIIGNVVGDDAIGDVIDDITNGDGITDDTINTFARITGTITRAAKHAPTASGADTTYMVVAQSSSTGEVYTTTTSADGSFTLELPENESGATFTVTLVNNEGKPMGAMLFGDDGAGMGYTGLEVLGDVSLGTLDVPADPGTAPIKPGDDSALDAAVIAEDVLARLNTAGAPVGADNVGKGDDAKTSNPTSNSKQTADADMDGMIDIFDADDNGNGTIDELDPDQKPDVFDDLHGLNLVLFMNLKISDADAGFYFGGDVPNIEKSLREDTVITFELFFDGRAGRTLVAANVLAAPAPPYLPDTVLLGGGGKWVDSGFALQPAGANHFNAFVTPNAIINAGDTFVIEAQFDDGSTARLTRMINFAFHSIPKANVFGPPASASTSVVVGTNQFDGSQDLELRWNPPVDERGTLILGFDYRFEVFFHDATGAQINGIDKTATWPTMPTGFNGFSFDVPGADLAALDSANQLAAILPHGIFVDTVTQDGGATVAVASYVIDIAAQKNGNNSALKVRFAK